MKMELSMRELEIHVNRQLTNMFGPCGDLLPYLHVTLERVEECFKVTQNKYYKNWEGGGISHPTIRVNMPYSCIVWPIQYIVLVGMYHLQLRFIISTKLCILLIGTMRSSCQSIGV